MDIDQVDVTYPGDYVGNPEAGIVRGRPNCYLNYETNGVKYREYAGVY